MTTFDSDDVTFALLIIKFCISTYKCGVCKTVCIITNLITLKAEPIRIFNSVTKRFRPDNKLLIMLSKCCWMLQAILYYLLDSKLRIFTLMSVYTFTSVNNHKERRRIVWNIIVQRCCGVIFVDFCVPVNSKRSKFTCLERD